jgi:hypothetical protein
MFRSGFVAISLTVLAACGGGGAEPTVAPQPDSDAASASAPAPAPAAATPASGGGQKSTLEVKADGKPADFAHVLATSEGGSAITLEISNKPVACPKPGGGRDMPPEGWKSFSITVAPKLSADGSTGWAVLRTSYDNFTNEGEAGSAKVVEGDATKGVTVELPETTVKGMEGKELSLKGRLVAKGCGVVPSVWRNGLGDKDPEPKPVPQPGFTLTVAGKAQPVVSALLMKRGGAPEELKLSTAAASCNVGFGGADVEHTIRLKNKKPDFAALRGGILPSQMSGGFGGKSAPAPTLTLGAEAKGAVPVTLSGEYEMPGGYKVKVDGKLDATVCDRK